MNKKLYLNKYLGSMSEVYYSIYKSPLGEICIFGNENSLKAVVYGSILEDKNELMKKKEVKLTPSIKSANNYLNLYFNGKPLTEIKFLTDGMVKPGSPYSYKSETLHLDLNPFTDNEIAVYRSLIKVIPGSRISYKMLSLKSGFPNGARFIGNTMAKNLFPVIIPCHRVIKEDGSMGNYTGGPGIKKRLLDFEEVDRK